MNKRKRNFKVEFYVNEKELDIIDKKSQSVKLDRSKYLRKVALGQATFNIDMSYLNKVIFELNKIGTNINQIAKVVNQGKSIYKNEVIELQEQMKNIWSKIEKNF